MFFDDMIRNDYCFLFVYLLMLMLLYLNRRIQKQVQGAFWRLIAMSAGLFVLQYLDDYLVAVPGANRWCMFVSYLKYALRPVLLWQVLMIAER